MILLLESIHPAAERLLRTVGDQVVLSATHSVGEDLGDQVRAIVTRGLGQVPADVFARLPNLQVVGRCGVGLDNIDTEAAAAAGVAVVHAPGSTTFSVAEHALMLMLSLARRVVELDQATKAKNWNIREGYQGIEMRGKQLGVIGLGAIGSRIAELGAALLMDVVCTGRRDYDGGIRQLPLDELLRTSDVIQLCVPLTEDTRAMIGSDQLAMMKPGSLLINTARGPIVDHQALGAALDHGPLAGYAADVWQPEPPTRSDPLIADPRVLVTPHISALTDVTYHEICMRPTEAIVAILSGAEPDPTSIYGGAS